MSFDLNNTGKVKTGKIEYNYYNTNVGNQLKNIKNNGYLKYELENSNSVGFSNPNLFFNKNQYVSQNLYVFNRFYEIQNVNYDGILIIENKPITNPIFHSNIFTVFLLKTSSFVSPNTIDKLLLEKGDESITMDLNALISPQQPCIVFENVILFTYPILIHSRIGNLIAPEYVSVGLLNSFTNDYSIMKAVQYSGKDGETIEGMEGREGMEGQEESDIYNTMSNVKFEEDVTCKASDDVNNKDISKIAMVPVDSDFLNGVYQISMMRTLFDIFVFIMILFFCFFASPHGYKYFIIDFVNIYNDDYDEKKMMNLLDIIFIVLFLMISVFLVFNGFSKKNSIEGIIGVYLTIIIIFSIFAIQYNKKMNNSWEMSDTPFSLKSNYILKFMSFLNDSNFFSRFFGVLSFFLLLFIIVYVCNFIFNFNKNIVNYLILIPPVSMIIAYIIMVIYANSNKTSKSSPSLFTTANLSALPLASLLKSQVPSLL
jgi:hypothetical protein